MGVKERQRKGRKRAILLRLMLLPIVAAVVIKGMDEVLVRKQWVWSGDEIHRIAQGAVGMAPEAALEHVREQLESRLPGRIATDTTPVFMNAGGWMGTVVILYASTTEYVLFFGTGIHTSGHSGRYWATIEDTITSGTFEQWKEGELTARSFGPGDRIVHAPWAATGVEWSAGTYMLEYGRGVLPSTLPFALADSVFGTLDVPTICNTLWAWVRLAVPELVYHYTL